MATITQTFHPKKECKHSVVFEPAGLQPNEEAIASSVYINKKHLKSLSNKIQLTLTTAD